MIREFVAGLQGVASAWAIAAPDVFLGASGVGMVFAHLVASVAAHGATVMEAFVATSPLGLARGEGSPTWLPPGLVAVFAGMHAVGVSAALGQLSEGGLHGIVVGDPVVASVVESGSHF